MQFDAIAKLLSSGFGACRLGVGRFADAVDKHGDKFFEEGLGVALPGFLYYVNSSLLQLWCQ